MALSGNAYTLLHRMDSIRIAGEAEKGDVESFFLSEYPALCRIAFVILGDWRLAEEVAMDGIVQAVSGWNRIRALKHPEAYVRRTVINLCFSRLRRKTLELRANARMVASTDTAESAMELRSDVLAALRRLPKKQLGCVVLHYLEDRPEREIAEIMGCSKGTVKSQLFKARSKLQVWLGDEDG